MPKPTVVVFDYGFGNVRSALNSLIRAGADAKISADPDEAVNCTGLVVPGVGAFAACMNGLVAANGPNLIEQRLRNDRPVLGICVGMQVMFERGLEHGDPSMGLGRWKGDVTALQAPVVPHMGWNTVKPPKGSNLFSGIADQRFYFVHSYAAHQAVEGAGVTWATHGQDFIAAVEDGVLSATQFHPEKSGEVGIAFLRNWIANLN